MPGAIDISQDIRSLTDFKRHTAELTEQLKATGRPLVLTVNGKAELVVQDPASYQALLEAAELAATVEGIRRGLEQMERGEGRLAEDVFAEFRARHGIHSAPGAGTDS
jgi:PHD/YefM family antitoxin component YafN of YafNO toxin-antitoxin module